MTTPTLSRRSVLLAGLGALPLAALRAVAPDKVPVVDAHLHCFAGKDDARFPYHANAPYKPEASATPEHLLKCMDGAGVDFAVVVHPEPYQDDHRYLEHCLTVGKGRLKGTCLLFADRPNSIAQLPALAKKLSLVAVRVHAYAPDRLPPFGKPELRTLWKQAGDLGLAVQLHFEPRYAPDFEPLVQDFPDVRVIIDHLGRPFQGTPKEFGVVVRWARFKNTILKISALPEKVAYPHRDINPILKELTTAFGSDRLIYGGGFDAAATGKSYKAARDQIAAHLAFLPAGDLPKVLGGNAAKLFRFGA